MSGVAMSASTPVTDEVPLLLAALHQERERHLQAVAEIDRTLQQINKNLLTQEETETRHAEIAGVLEDVNRRYGDMFRRLARGPDA